jgi:hypothetical protein
MGKGDSVNQHYEETNIAIHDTLTKRFFMADKNNDIETMLKVTAQIGYIQQIHLGLNKNLLAENEIKNINKRLDRIPPEILEQYVTNPELLVGSKDI